jgi:hypothetical protein
MFLANPTQPSSTKVAWTRIKPVDKLEFICPGPLWHPYVPA